MSSDHASTLFFELFSGLARLGPGNSHSTRRALTYVRELTKQDRILDVGCGTGAQTLILAESTRAHVVAIDTHRPFLDELNRTVVELNVTDQVTAVVGDMRQLAFTDGSFDLIWCESAIYNIGVENALQDWCRLLKARGSIAFTEICWKKPNPPVECREFWEREYPAIRNQEALFRAIEARGVRLLGNFELDVSAWWDAYYQPLQRHLNVFREKHPDDKDAQELCDQCQYEIDIWHAYAEFFGCEFFVVQRN